MICESHGLPLKDGFCRACLSYNAAVTAQQAAAQEWAKSIEPGAGDAWLNEHGLFAWVGGRAIQLASAEEAAPFAALTGEAIRAATKVARATP